MLLHRKLTGSMIGYAFKGIHELGSGFWESLLKIKVMVELKGVKTLVQEHAAQTINKPSCISCPSMLIRDRLMLEAETQRAEHNFVTLV